MTRSEVIEVLKEYNKLLISEGYADTDIYGESENDSAIDRFMQTDWFKSHFVLNRELNEPLNIHVSSLEEESIIQRLMNDANFKRYYKNSTKKYHI